MSESHLSIHCQPLSGESFTLRVSPYIPFRVLEEKMQQHTGYPIGHTMMFMGERLVNRYNSVGLHKVFPEHPNNEVVLRLVQQEVMHPEGIVFRGIPPLSLWRPNNHYDKEHPDFLPLEKQERGLVYFQNKSNKKREVYETTPEGRIYLELIQPSLDAWGGLLIV